MTSDPSQAGVELTGTLDELRRLDAAIARESFEAPHGSRGIPGGLREARRHRARLAGQALELATAAGLPRPAITAGEMPEPGAMLAYLLSM
ncbi:MAG: hypothetical protein ACYC61_14130 [Isosphaeraceae bacterium]